MKSKLDMERIAKKLGAERRGKVTAKGGYFGALQLAADVQERFRVPSSGGRATDPSWNLRRQIPMTEETLHHLEALARKIEEHAQVPIAPMQLAALILEMSAAQLSEREAESLVRQKARA